MAITVGDAVFNFLGDTTQLDQAWQKAETDASAKAPVVQQQINTMGTAWDQTGQQAQNAAQQTTQAAEQMATAAQGAGAAASEAAQVASPEWLALARATDTATRATIEHSAAQKELEAAIAKAAQSTEGDQAALSALAAAEEKVAIAAANLAAAQKETEIASQAATASMRAEAEAAAQSSIALKEAATAALAFGQDSKLAGEQAAFSMQEAKGSIALAGEEIGVTIPRHIRGFIAELPGVGAALEAAFSGIALLVLAQIIVEATEKLTEFVSETFIYTDAEKEAYAATIELNKTLVDQAAKLKDLQEQYRLIGLEGPAKTKEEFMILTEEVNKNEAALRAAKNTLATFREEQRNGADLGAIHTVTEEQANAAGAAILALTALLKTQYQQQAAFEKQYDQESLQEQIQHGEASINATKTRSEARIELARAESTLRLTLAKAGYSSLIQAQQDFDNQMYQAQLKALQDTLANEAKDPTRNQDRIKELNAQIIALESEHQAKILDIRLKGIQAYRNAILGITMTLKEAFDAQEKLLGQSHDKELIPYSEAGRQLNDLIDTMKKLGVDGSAVWVQQRIEAEDAYNKIRESGIATVTDILQAYEKLTRAKLGEAIHTQLPGSEEDQRRIQELTELVSQLDAQLKKLGIDTDKSGKSLTAFDRIMRDMDKHMSPLGKIFDGLIKHTVTTGQAVKAMGAMFVEALGASVTAALSSAQGFGEAMQQMLKSVLATLAGEAVVQAIKDTALGFEDLAAIPPRPAQAAAHFHAAELWAAVGVAAAVGAAAMNGGGNSGNQSAPQTEAAAGIQQGPVEQAPAQTQNVPRFATGAVVTGPTLAIFGEAMNSANNAIAQTLAGPGQMEAAIPLEDDRATSAIAQAITKHMPPIRVTTNVHGKSLRHLIKDINHEVKNNDVELHSSNTYRVTKKA